VLTSSAVDRGFIGGVIVSIFRLECSRSWAHRWCKLARSPQVQ
jgi:hypothetical protein